MRIGILIDRLTFGGVEKVAIEQVNALNASGHNASLLVMRGEEKSEPVFDDMLSKTPVVVLDERLPGWMRFSFGFPFFHFFSWFHLSYSVFLPLVVRKKEFDYIIAHGTYTSLSAVALKKRRDINFSAFIWDPVSYILERVYKDAMPRMLYYPIKNVATSLDSYLVRNMDSVLVGGGAHNKYLLGLCPRAKIHTVYPSVHPSTKKFKKQAFVLVVTAWKRGKNPEYLMDLAQNMPELHIKMAGAWLDDKYFVEFTEQVAKRRLTDQIEILGAQSEKSLSSLYGSALVLLQTNDDRGFGMPALEAAAHGTSFIIPRGQGVCELFEDGVDGFYTSELDTATIIRYIRTFMTDEHLAKDMGRTALNKVLRSYSWEKHAAQLVTIADAYGKNNSKDNRSVH